jgi:hypothetical protein
MDDNEYMLTTIDNPYNPYTHYDEWYEYDTSKGYNSASFLARIAKTSFEMSDADQDLAIQNAIDEICKQNVLGIYTKAMKPTLASVDSTEM